MSCVIPDDLEIGYDKEQDIKNGFRVSKKGIVLVTRDMLTALAEKQQVTDNTKEVAELA